MTQYEGLEINPERGFTDYEQQIMELETQELIALYEMMEEGPTPFHMIADELSWRAEWKLKLETEGQVEEIEELGLVR